MRDGKVRYLLADGAIVTQVAEVLDREATVEDVIRMGVALVDMLNLNGAGPTTTRATPTQSERAARRQAVLDYLRAHPDSRAADIAAALGLTEDAVRHILESFRGAGIATPREVGGSKGRPAYAWRLVDGAEPGPSAPVAAHMLGNTAADAELTPIEDLRPSAIEHVRQHPDIDVRTLAGLLDIANHRAATLLNGLTRDGVLVRSEAMGAKGRPKGIYRLAEGKDGP